MEVARPLRLVLSSSSSFLEALAQAQAFEAKLASVEAGHAADAKRHLGSGVKGRCVWGGLRGCWLFLVVTCCNRMIVVPAVFARFDQKRAFACVTNE